MRSSREIAELRTEARATGGAFTSRTIVVEARARRGRLESRARDGRTGEDGEEDEDGDGGDGGRARGEGCVFIGERFPGHAAGGGRGGETRRRGEERREETGEEGARRRRGR